MPRCSRSVTRAAAGDRAGAASREPHGAPQRETTIPPLSGLGEPPARSGGGERTRARARAKCFYKIILSWGCSSEVPLPPYAFCEILEEILFSKSLKKNDRFRRATKTSSVLKGGKKRGGQGCQGFNINCDTESVKRGVAPLPRSVSGVFGAQKCLF